VNRKELFDLIGAPLNNFQWSWGAVRSEDRTVFLCVWRDKVRRHEGALIVPLTNFKRPDTTHGHRERLEHIRQIQNGARCYLFMCEAEDTSAQPRRLITDFGSPEVFQGGRLFKLDEDWWIEITPGPSINELAPKTTASV
jgi:hypothetical protein